MSGKSRKKKSSVPVEEPKKIFGDPTIEFLPLRYTFGNDPEPSETRDQIFAKYLHPHEANREKEISLAIDFWKEGEEIEHTVYVTDYAGKYSELQDLKDRFGEENFRETRDFCNLYSELGRSKFINRAAVKLANIDAIFDVTNSSSGEQRENPAVFVDVASGPGGFSEYMFWRCDFSRIYAMTLRNKETTKNRLDFNLDILPKDKFFPVYGDDGTGDLIKNAEFFVREVLRNKANGVELVTADGGFDIETGGNYREQELLSVPLILSEFVIGTTVLQEGGNFVCKLFDTIFQITVEMIYLVSLCFDRIFLFKPISSRPANAEKYLVCIGYKRHEKAIEGLLTALQAVREGKQLKSLVTKVDRSFSRWMFENNDDSTEQQHREVSKIVASLDGNQEVINEIATQKGSIDIQMALICWNLPI